MVKVCVTWNKETFTVDLVEDQPVAVFRSQLWSLTGVPPQRQKVMIPSKGLLRDNMEIRSLGIKEGAKVMLVGTAEGKELKAPAEKTVFIEDLTAEEKARIFKEKQVEILPPGLMNLGTTCYLNSVVQFTRPVDEFTSSVKALPANLASVDPEVSFCAAFRELYTQLENTTDSLIPSTCIQKLREVFPQFARRSTSSSGYMQQDAEECLMCIVEVVRRFGRSHNVPSDSFQFRLDSSLKCLETDNEPIELKNEDVLKLSCHLGTQTSPVDHLHQGIKLSLEETIEKLSPSLNRQAQYRKVSRIASLPNHLIVHFVRFEWKKAHELARTDAGRAKIVRKVNFSRRFDVFEFCSDSLQADLRTARDVLHQRMEKEAADRNRPAQEPVKSSEQPKTGENSEDVVMEDATTEKKPTGYYDLVSVVTHQGRTAESGHYVGWVRKSAASPDTWLKMDDDKVTEMKWDDLDLAGGRSDYHIAILLMYKKDFIEPTQAEWEESKSAIATLTAATNNGKETEKKSESILL